MIKKVRWKFVLVTMLLLFSIFSIIVIGLSVYNSYWNTKENFGLMEWIANTESLSKAQSEDIGTLQFGFDEETPFPYQLYTVKLDKSNRITAIASNTDLSKDYFTEEMTGLVNNAISKDKVNGKSGTYLFFKEAKDYGTFLVLLNTKVNGTSQIYIEYLWDVLIILLFGGLLFLTSLVLSRFVTTPVEESFNKQKQFISDASHELKTPLAAILVNADVLSAEIGENKYMTNIKSEAARMDGLIRKLLELARADDTTRTLCKTTFDLSEAVYQIVLPFESMAFEANIEYQHDICDNVKYIGDCEDIKQVIAILLDNAFKHTPQYGRISVSLKLKGERPILAVYNTGDGISQKDLPHIFERFYCCDDSRSQSKKSYGLGLAIAKSIIQAHGGAIKAESENGSWAKFTIVL